MFWAITYCILHSAKKVLYQTRAQEKVVFQADDTEKVHFRYIIYYHSKISRKFDSIPRKYIIAPTDRSLRVQYHRLSERSHSCWDRPCTHISPFL